MQGNDLSSTLLQLASTSVIYTRTCDKSCFSAAVQTLWARSPEVASELLGELGKQARSRRATQEQAAGPCASTDQKTPTHACEPAVTANYISVATQTLVEPDDVVMPRARRTRKDDLLYRPPHSAAEYTRSRQEQQKDAENGPPAAEPGLPSPKSPDAQWEQSIASQSRGTRSEAETSPCPSVVDDAACEERAAARKSSISSLSLAQSLPRPDDRDFRDDAQDRNATNSSMTVSEIVTMPITSQESEKGLIKAPQDKFTAATCLFLVSEEKARRMIFDAARDIRDMEKDEERAGDQVHQGILDSLKLDPTAGGEPSQPAGSVWSAGRLMCWSLTMWMNVLGQGRAAHKKSGILRKIEWMGASAWFDYQVEQASKAPPRTRRGIPMKRVSTAVLDCMLHEAQDESSPAPSEHLVNRTAQQRKTFIDICNKGKRLRQIVQVVGIGILFYRRIWDLIKLPQDQVGAVVSHLSDEPGKATAIALLGEQVELLVSNGRPDTALFLGAVEAKLLVSADDVSSLRLDYGSSMSCNELRRHIDQLKNGLHQVLGKRELDHEDTVTLSGKSIPGDSFSRLDTGEWFDVWLLEAALEIQDRPAWVKLGPCVSTHEVVNGKVKTIQAPFRRLRSEVESLRATNSIRRPQDGLVFLCPLNIKTNHFTLLEVNEQELMIYHYDSYANRSSRAGLSKGDFVQCAVQEEFKGLGFSYVEAPTPQQQDSSSCGPMVVRNASQRTNGLPVGEWTDRLDPAQLRASVVGDLHAFVTLCGIDPDPRRSKRIRGS